MENGNGIFQDYNEENNKFSALIKKPRFWITIFVVFVSLVLILILVKSTRDSLSTEELQASIEITSVDTKWVDKTVSPAEITIVPAITITFKNIGRKSLKYIKLTAVFNFEEGGEQLTDGYTPLFEKSIDPGQESGEIFIKGINGYSASSKEAFIKNITEWKKVRVKLFARTNSGFALLGEFPVKQEIAGINKDYRSESVPDQGVETSRLSKLLQVVWTDTLWIDKPGAKNEVIIVPVIKLKLKNLGSEILKDLFIKGEFEFVEKSEKIGEDFLAIPGQGLAPGAVSDEIILKSDFGYTAVSKASFIKNREIWKKVRVRILIKEKDAEFVPFGIFPVRQKISGVKVVYQQ